MKIRQYPIILAGLLIASYVGTEMLAAEDNAPLTVVREQGTTQIFAPRGESKAKVQEYIDARHRVLDELAESAPDETIEAQISFREYLDAERFKARMRSVPVSVVSLNFGWQEQVSGYDIQQNESLDDALQNAAAHHREFVDELYTSAREQLEMKAQAGTSAEDLERHALFYAHAVEIKNTFDRRGVLLFGVKIRAKAHAIREMKVRDPLIRLADPLWEPHAPTGRVRKIGIPISPYHYER